MYQKYIKRLTDFVFSLSAIVALSPLMTILSALIGIRLGRPVLFRQKRPGYNEKLFVLYKFRTMADRKDKNGRLLPDDKRITKFGKTIRAASLDELPELFNVLKGDMSIVGPRPLLVKYLPYYRKEERQRSRVRPGITGLAQINGRNALSWEERFRLDIEYVKSLSFRLDMKILLKTITAVWKRKDILVGEEHILNDLDVERKEERPNNVDQKNSEEPSKLRFSEEPSKLRFSEEPAEIRFSEEPAEIRFFSETDIVNNEDTIKDLLNDSMRINFPDTADFSEYVRKACKNMQDCLKDGSAILIGAFSGTRAVGFLWAYCREFLGEQRIHISHIIVNENERSKGLGTRLIKFLEAAARSNDIKKLELITSAGNKSTLDFYGAQGYFVTRVQLEKEL